MRRIFLPALLCILSTTTLRAADPPGKSIDLQSDRIGVVGLPLADCKSPVMQLFLKGSVDAKGKGKGTLTFDFTASPQYDEFGFAIKHPTRDDATHECTFEFVRKTTKTIVSRRLGAPENEAQEYKMTWELYSIRTPKLKTPLFVSIYDHSSYPTGRFLVHDEAGKVKHVVDMRMPPQPEPCHPGCFPPGTEVRIASGTTTIEKVQKGDSIATVDPDGKVVSKAVTAVFVTKNRLLEVHVKDRMLVTTETQPLALVKGGYRPAGELKPGDRIWIWAKTGRVEVAVERVEKTNRESDVYNLVLGDPTTFIAGGFLVRSKPPLKIANGDSPVVP